MGFLSVKYYITTLVYIYIKFFMHIQLVIKSTRHFTNSSEHYQALLPQVLSSCNNNDEAVCLLCLKCRHECMLIGPAVQDICYSYLFDEGLA